MKDSLLRWIGDADALRHMERLGVREVPLVLSYQLPRKDDLFISLVGELFDRMREDYDQPNDWARLGNALGQYATADSEELKALGISRSESALFSAAAFYFGGFPASSCLTMRTLGYIEGPIHVACYELLARLPVRSKFGYIEQLRLALLTGGLNYIAKMEEEVAGLTATALHDGPDRWIPLRLLQSLLGRFRRTNIRAILPEGGADYWKPLISSLLHQGTWDFFPSQIDAIQRGLLTKSETFSLQMPTGAGKTALCETLLFYHLSKNPEEAAVLLVPYRSLASELRTTLVRRLSKMGISSRCAYGGTVPTGDEVHAFDETRMLVATPESLSGILSANTTFAKRITLVICDEGHLLDAPTRGIGFELLLSRMKIRDTGTQRFVFVSAIVPNIEEINLWLGGTENTVVRSDYRPAIAEFSVLRQVSKGSSSALDLEMHPHEEDPIRYRIEKFLCREDFQWQNPATGRTNTYSFSSVKTRAIAAARKALPMGSAVVFSANKGGNQGAIGLAEELLGQMEQSLPLPNPLSYAKSYAINLVADYLMKEYGENWVGTRALRAGAVLHHGDIPQETREVLERLLREGEVALGICTNTLAEGVNLPIRTLVLYSVQRLLAKGARENLLTRDIKNLVGRAGRAGSTTKGLVICTNEDQWPLVAAVANQAAGEPVVGALRSLIDGVYRQLAVKNISLTNEILEASPIFHSLIDGIDSTLIDLAASEIGEDELLRMASELADQTFASRQTNDASKKLLRDVFELRAHRIVAVRSAGRLEWIRETGTRARMLDLVETGLLPMRSRWDDVLDPLDPSLVNPILEWAWTHRELQKTVREVYRLDPEDDFETLRDPFFAAVWRWLSGADFIQVAEAAGLSVDKMLGVHSRVLTFELQTIVEQAVALLEKLLQAYGQAIAPVVAQFPEHLRFGVKTAAGCILAAGGIRHRRAYVELGNVPIPQELVMDRSKVFSFVNLTINSDLGGWQNKLGVLVFENTRHDLRVALKQE